MNSRLPRILPFLGFGLFTLSAHAGLTVTQNLGTGASSWPDGALLSSCSNPASALTIEENFSSYSSYGQTFTIPDTGNFTLDTIYLYAGGGTGTSDTATITVHLYDLGYTAAPNPSSYIAENDKLGSGNGLALTYSPQSKGLLKLDFDGDDQALLIGGHLYAFELEGTQGTDPIRVVRSVSDTYAGGAGYRDRAWIWSNPERELGLALFASSSDLPTPAEECTVNADILHQEIDGFGAGVAFLYSVPNPLPQEYMDFLYGSGEDQISLDILRIRINDESEANWSDAITNAQRASLQGAQILATPWSPPHDMKINLPDESQPQWGGRLDPEKYGDYVDYLNHFIATMAENNAPVSVISLQNEPDFLTEEDNPYASCLWTDEEFRTFCRDYAGDINAPVMIAESYGYNQSMTDATLNDATARANINYIGEHLYGATIKDYPLARQYGKHIWMTEHLENDQTIEAAVATAVEINTCLSVGNFSAYVWWKTIGDANGLLDASGVPQIRSYVMGQFSRFIQPGYVRIDTAEKTGPLSISACINPDGPELAIVVANNSSHTIEQTFNLQGLNAGELTPWITSATQSLEAQTPVTLENDSFNYTLPPYSVITFQGSAPRGMSFADYLAGLDLSAEEHTFASDLDNDTLCAGMEYLLGTNPAESSIAKPQWILSSTDETISLAVSPLVIEGTLELQTSSDLRTWSTLASYDFATKTTEGFQATREDDHLQLISVLPQIQDSTHLFFRFLFQMEQ